MIWKASRHSALINNNRRFFAENRLVESKRSLISRSKRKCAAASIRNRPQNSGGPLPIIIIHTSKLKCPSHAYCTRRIEQMLNERLVGSSALSRRGLIRWGVSAIAALGAAPIVHATGTGRALKMSYLFDHDSQLGAGADEFARRIRSATDGAWRIDQYPGGAFGGELEMIEALRKGELDLAFITGAVFANIAPAFGVLDLPFLFHNASHAHAVLDGPIGRNMLDRFRQHDLVALAWGENGMRHITNSLRPIHTPEDLRGLKMRVPQSEVMLRCFRQLGVDTAPMAFPALYGALESGRFDGQENPIAVIRAAEFDRVQQHLTLTGHIYSNAVIFMSKDAWSGLGC